MNDHKLILECFHPAMKFRDPYFYCDYLGTPGLSDTSEGQGLVYHDEENIGRLGKLGGLYSRFRPIKPEEEHRVFLRRPGDLPGQSGLSLLVPHPPPPGHQSEGLVSHNINLDTDEPFSQLCVVTNLVKVGPRRGVFLNFVNISDGLVRVMRPWLAKRAHPADHEDEGTRTLWLDNQSNVGLRVRVTEKNWRKAAPVLLHRDEDPAVSYFVEYEGEIGHFSSERRTAICSLGRRAFDPNDITSTSRRRVDFERCKLRIG
ncbi:hypothetical protein MMC10_010860 [Thelotrema lepadinum]|nr:hypothetical protein [Thelotrema lepadinum]